MDREFQETPGCQQDITPRGLSVRDHSPVLPLLEMILDPNGTQPRDFRDSVIVSLDLEYDSKPPMIHQIGLSVLDIRHLANTDIQDLHSVTPSASNPLFLLQKGRRCRAYCYGDPLLVDGISLDKILHPFLAIQDERGDFRNVVLVGHLIDADLSLLERCGLNLNSLNNVKACIDIAPACSHFLCDRIHRMSLKHICQHLEIRTFSYHNAAHDALYTLQALLKLSCLYKDDESTSPYKVLSSLKTRRNQIG